MANLAIHSSYQNEVTNAATSQHLKHYNDIQSDEDDEPILYTYKATSELVYFRIINASHKPSCVHTCIPKVSK